MWREEASKAIALLLPTLPSLRRICHVASPKRATHKEPLPQETMRLLRIGAAAAPGVPAAFAVKGASDVGGRIDGGSRNACVDCIAKSPHVAQLGAARIAREPGGGRESVRIASVSLQCLIGLRCRGPARCDGSGRWSRITSRGRPVPICGASQWGSHRACQAPLQCMTDCTRLGVRVCGFL